MPFPQEEWTQYRCSNPSCPGLGQGKVRQGIGRVVVEHHEQSGMYRKKIGVLRGQPLYIRMLMPPAVPCLSCGRPWINPAVRFYDDWFKASQQAVMDAAEQVRLSNERAAGVTQMEDHHPSERRQVANEQEREAGVLQMGDRFRRAA